MSDLAKLKSVLQQAAADGIQPPRPMPFSAPELGAALILDAVDGALLGRRITVEAGPSGAVLIIDAVGRRLQRVVAPVPDQFAISAHAELKPDDASALAAGLMAFCEGRGELTLSTQPVTHGGDPAEGGISTARVRQELGLEDVSDGAGDMADLNMEALIAGLTPTCNAALWIQGEDVSLVIGDQARVKELSEWVAPMLERLLSPEFPLSASLETDGVMVFMLPETVGNHLVIAGRLGAYLVAEMKGSDPDATLSIWRKTRS